MGLNQTKEQATPPTTQSEPESETKITTELGRQIDETDPVDLCFMLDCTGSMQPYIDMARNKIHDVITKVKEEYPQAKIRIGIVAYRDVQDNNRFEIFPFEASPDKAKNFLAGLRADGGGDTPEDVNGAFQKALFSMDWRNPIRLLVHIADAPCHGKDFHSADDNHPKGYKEDMKWDQIFKELVAKKLDYLFIKILPVTDKMFEKFNALAEKHGSLEAEVSFQQEQLPNLPASVSAPVSASSYRRSCWSAETVGRDYEVHKSAMESDFVEKVARNVKCAISKRK